MCARRSFRLRCIFSSHANTGRDRDGDGDDSLVHASETDARSRPNSLFCANTSREAHAESHTNINHIYCGPNESLSAKTADATSGFCPPSFTACEPGPRRFRRGSLAQRDQPVNRSSHVIKYKSHPPTRRFRNDDSPSPSARLDAFLFHGRNTRLGSLNFWQSDKPFTPANTSFSPG